MHSKDKENRRIPFDPEGRLAAILRRREKLESNAFVFGTDNGELAGSFRTAWESLLLLANGYDTKRNKPGARVDRAKLQQTTCTGTTCAMRAPAGSWRMASTSASSS